MKWLITCCTIVITTAIQRCTVESMANRSLLVYDNWAGGGLGTRRILRPRPWDLYTGFRVALSPFQVSQLSHNLAGMKKAWVDFKAKDLGCHGNRLCLYSCLSTGQGCGPIRTCTTGICLQTWAWLYNHGTICILSQTSINNWQLLIPFEVFGVNK